MTYDETTGDIPAFPVNTTNVTDPGSCFPAPGMSVREYAAIHLKVPNSGTDWLDEMIRKSILTDDMRAAMVAFITSAIDPYATRAIENPSECARWAEEQAIDMQARREMNNG